MVNRSAYKREEYINKLRYIEHAIKNMTRCAIKNLSNTVKCYSIYSDDDDDTYSNKLCVITVGWKYGNHFLNIAINPSNLTLDGGCELQSLFSVLFNNHYEELYEKGVISHFEFYVDVPNTHLADLVLIDAGKRKTTLYRGTTYHGGRKSKLTCTIYDRAAKLKIDSALTRIEARINRRDLLFKDLVENGIPNPFDKFFVVPAEALKLIAQEWKQPQLPHMIREFGVYGATHRNPAARKKLLERLHEHTVPWWQPDLFWETNKKMLLEFKPEFLGGNTYGDKENVFDAMTYQS